MADMELMQDSGVEWLGEIPEGWNVSKLKYVTNQIVDGTHFTPTYVENGVPFLRVTDIQTKAIDLTQVKFIPESEHQELIKRAKPERGDVLLSKNGTIGIIKVVDWDWEFSIFVSLCLIKFQPKINPHYFSYFFESDVVDRQISESCKRTSVTNLHLVKIRELLLCFPSIAEQQAIADYLDNRCSKLDAVIALKQQQIKTLDALRQSIIYHAVTKGLDPAAPLVDSGVEWLGEIPKGWKISKLRYEISIRNGDFISNKLDSESQYPVVGGNGFMGRTDSFNVNGDIIVIGRVGAYCGNVHYIKEKSWISDNALIVDTLNNKRFFTYLLNAFNLNSIANRTAQPVVTATNIKAIYVPIPRLTEQQAIVTHLDHETERLNRLKQNLSQQINTLQAYKKSLIYEVVTGKKRVAFSV